MLTNIKKVFFMENNHSEIVIDNNSILRNATKVQTSKKIEHSSSATDDLKYYFKEFIDENDQNTVIVNSKDRVDFDVFLNLKYNSIVNFHKINDIRYINKYFEKVNSLLPDQGLFIGNFESSSQRFTRLIRKYPETYAYLFHTLTFILKRIFPKWSLTKRLYFSITKGKNRYLPLAEVLGRLVSCGFEIINYKEMNNLTYFVGKKIGEPSFDYSASYGLLIKLPRVGKNGKLIKVYKLRTMHPYAEYLQEYIHKKNELKKGGKFKDDFRIAEWGKVFRKLWIDELPMLVNLAKGDLKIVGVRPLSEHYISLYPKKLQDLRIKTKPGLFPPFYLDMPNTLEEIIKSEEKYLNQYFEHPIKTDIKYFKEIMKNILFKGNRSS